MADHIAETELVLYSFDPASVSADRRAAIQRHISECSDCRMMLDFFERRGRLG